MFQIVSPLQHVVDFPRCLSAQLDHRDLRKAKCCFECICLVRRRILSFVKWLYYPTWRTAMHQMRHTKEAGRWMLTLPFDIGISRNINTDYDYNAILARVSCRIWFSRFRFNETGQARWDWYRLRTNRPGKVSPAFVEKPCMNEYVNSWISSDTVEHVNW